MYNKTKTACSITLYTYRLGTEMRSESDKKEGEIQELRKVIEQQKRDIEVLNQEIEAVKEQNNRAPTTTMKNLVERLKNQLALKEKQHQVGVAGLSWKHKNGSHDYYFD